MFGTKSHYHFPFNFRLFLSNTYFILLSVEATNFDLFKSYLKNINYVIHFNQNDNFADDCVVKGNKFEIILTITIVFVWNTGTNNERKKTVPNYQAVHQQDKMIRRHISIFFITLPI